MRNSLIVSLIFILLSLPAFCLEKINPQALAHFLTAEVYYWQGKEEEALKELKKAEKLDSTSIYLKRRLSYLLLRKGDLQEARKTIKEALKSKPKDRELSLILVEIYQKEGKFYSALRILKQLLKEKPEEKVFSHLVQLCFKFKRLKEAKKWSDELLSRWPTYTNYTKQGINFLRAGEKKKAREYLEEAVRRNPQGVEAWILLGSLYEGEKNFKKAEECYRHALALSPFSPFLYHRLGEIYSRQKPEDAISIYKFLLMMNPEDYLALQNLALLYYNQQEYQKSVDLLLSSSRKDAYTYYLIGSCFIHLEKWQEAEDYLKKSIQANPKFTPSYTLLSYLYSHLKKEREAMSILKQALSNSLSQEADIYLAIGLLHMQKKDYREALKNFKKARELAPESDEVYFRLGAAYERMGSWIRAVYHLRKAIRLNPENAEALNYLGYMFAEKGIRLNEALELITKALRIEPENGYFVDSLGWVYFQKGWFQKAKEELERAVKLLEKEGEDDPVIRDHLGDVYQHLGKIKEAIREWEKSLQLDPDNTKVREKIEKWKGKVLE